jgi:SWI/SNF-related matrix-associated actin-dependent regulator 1 of chromatin subfamily A
MITLQCNHIVFAESLSSSTDYKHCLDGVELMDYQVEGVKFLEEANARAILGDDQGLGKMIMGIALLKLHPELMPCIIACPTTIKKQWMVEIASKCGIKGFLTQVISSGKEFAAPGFDIYVTTYDLIKNEDCFKFVKDNIKLVILDEAQRIKNHLSERAKAIQKICKNVEHIIPMSGTMIKNNAGEYFTALNLVEPRMFPHYIQYIEKDCDSYNNGWGYKVGGLRNPQQFHEKTKHFILRRTKDEVLKDLPEKMRKFFHVELDGKVKKVYMQLIDELEELMYTESDTFGSASAKIAIMSKMRKITGISKVEAAVDFVTEFLMSNERKLTIFIHHHAVMDLLEARINQYLADGGFGYKTICIKADQNQDTRFENIRKFREEPNRILLASTLAAGEGINLQFCSDAVMMERQWNPANEVQAEDRFHRFGQKNSVSITYMIVSETIDEYFTNLVEQKRAIVMSTLDNKEMQWDQQSLMRELAEILVSKGKKAWSL